jgi:hypothetical protein
MKELTLSSIAKGKVELAFQRELAKVIKNISEPGTGGKAREVIIKLKFEPYGVDREKASLTVEVSSKLSPQDNITANFDITPNGNIMERFSSTDAPGQMMIDPLSGEIMDTPTYVIDATAKA